MTKNKPLVSIAMPIFNCGNTLKAAVRSILYQTYENWELLLIDDGSDDSSVSVAGEFCDQRIKLIVDGKRRGHGSRLNQALELSKGKYVARMDQDDICFPEKFARQVSYLEKNPEIDLLGTGALVFSDDARIKGIFPLRQSHSEICRRPWAGFYLPHPTWMGKIEWFRKFRYGGNEVLRAEDQDLLLRSYESSNFACLSEVLFGYRQNNLIIQSVLAGRHSFFKAVIREAILKRKYVHIPLVFFGQVMKGLTESVIVSLKLERQLLRHRALPACDETLTEAWLQIWGQCNL